MKRALPTARVGGPHVAGTRTPEATRFLRDFLEHCLRGKNHATGKAGSPLDFVAFHAKGSPRLVEGHVQTGIASQLQDIDRGFEVVASYPELKGKPIIIGESDPDGCAACPSTVYPQNGYRNGTLYASYTAASFARKYALAERARGQLRGGGDLGVRVRGPAVLRRVPGALDQRRRPAGAERLPHVRPDGRRAARRREQRARWAWKRSGGTGVRGKPDVSALASLRDGKVCVLAWHHHDDDVPGPDADVELSLSGLPAGDGPVLLEHFRIDRDHSNAFEAWKRMGSPQHPTPEQRADLVRASDLGLLGSPEWVRPEGGKLTLRFTLPRQAVSLLVLDPRRRSE